MSGRFITFEGGEGAGKSTQIQRLAARLREDGHRVLTTREPGGSPGAEALRGLLVKGEADRWDAMSETLLLYAARRDHLTKIILPARAEGQMVLCDRYYDSTMVYQGLGQGLGLKAVGAVHDLALGDLGPAAVTPDLTLIFDIPVEQGLARARSRLEIPTGGEAETTGETAPENRYEEMDRAFHERLRQGFLQIAASDPGRCRVLDATGPADRITEQITGLVHRLMGQAPA